MFSKNNNNHIETITLEGQLMNIFRLNKEIQGWSKTDNFEVRILDVTNDIIEVKQLNLEINKTEKSASKWV